MDGREPAGCLTDAQCFCVENYPWLRSTSELALSKRGFTGYGEDLAQEIAASARRIADDAWRQIRNHRGYIYRIVIHKANDFCQRNSHLVEELTDLVLASSSVEEIEAAILLQEISNKLTDEENELLEMMFESRSGLEMAARMGINYPASRKRIERLKKRLRGLCDGKDVHQPGTARVRKRVYRKL